jgi:GTPase
MKKQLHETAIQQKTAVLVGVVNKRQDEDLAKEYLDELAFLAETYGVKTLKYFMQKLEKPDKATFIGKGKLEEVKQYVST